MARLSTKAFSFYYILPLGYKRQGDRKRVRDKREREGERERKKR